MCEDRAIYLTQIIDHRKKEKTNKTVLKNI